LFTGAGVYNAIYYREIEVVTKMYSCDDYLIYNAIFADVNENKNMKKWKYM